jgi:hypothetical protein
MLNRPYVAAALLAALTLLPSAPVNAAVILITQAKANAGNVTPGDAAGFPVTLSLPGAYRFDTNITVPTGKHGLVVTAHDVTIDFAGFRLWSGGGALHGIIGTFNSITIKNGTIANFAGRGISGTGHFWSIENMRVAVNRQDGIFSSGRSWSIANSQIVENGKTGIYSISETDAPNGLIRNNVINRNGGFGLTSNGGHIEGNIISENQQDGVRLSGGGTILGNTFLFNTGRGISADGTVGYGNNTLSGNNGANPDVSGGFQLHPNTCNGAAC